ncbi:MAG: DUF692 domain-containing protein [Verrucomicrobiota bacterium]
MSSLLPALGVGLGFRAPHLAELFFQRAEIDFLEITADHFLFGSPEKERELRLLADHFTLIPHGLNLSLGSAAGLDMRYAEKFASLVEQLNPPWWSEHLAFTRGGEIEIGHLTPLPFTREAVEAVERNVASMRGLTSKPLILENITCAFHLPGAEMSEGEFLRRVCDATGCGWLLDVTNLYINSRNHGFDPRRWLDDAPLERIVQLHFVGSTHENGRWIDSHARPVEPEIWALLEEVLARSETRGAILERDEQIPPLAELLPELRTLREMGRSLGRWA